MIGLAITTQMFGCDPVRAKTITIINENNKEVAIRYEVAIDEIKTIGKPLHATKITQLALGETTLYENYKWERGSIVFFRPVDDSMGYTNYFSQKVYAGLAESEHVQIIPGRHDLILQCAGILKHYIVIKLVGEKDNRHFILQSASEVSKNGSPITVVTIKARINLRNPELMMPLIDEVAERLVEELTAKMEIAKK